MLIVFVSVIFFGGGIAVGVKFSKLIRERRKADALEYIRQTGIYPPIYSGYPTAGHQPTKNSGNDGAPLFDQILYMGIIAAALYAVWCGLT